VSAASPLRIGFIDRWSVHDASALSGMPAAAWAALGRQGLDLVHLDPEVSGPRRPWLEALAPAARALVPSNRRWDLRRRVEAALDRVPTPFLYRRALEAATALSRRIQKRIDTAELDAVFGLCVSVELCALETALPIVYASDATARLINTTYPDYARRPLAYHRACDEVERRSLRRVSAAVFASEPARRSAIEDYGVAPERAFVVPLGAHVVPAPDAPPLRPEPPHPGAVELVCVAADPVRKRLDFCIDVAEELARRGLRVRLNQVGPPTPRARRSKLVHRAGALRLSSRADRSVHAELLRRSHLLLLPSRGEMFGVAPCEAAHFGRPSLVSDTGGLPSAVRHGETGIVLPVDAPASRYADEIEKLCHDPQRYRSLSENALHRARTELTWDAWGRRVAEILRGVVAGGAARAG
jgi:YD repeat-containing protein